MEEFVRKLFSEYGFEDPISNERFLFFQKSGDSQVEYYLVELTNSNNLKDYLETEHIESLLSFFNVQKPKAPDIEKNTTLLVFAEAEELNQKSHDQFKRHIWRIEEDEYFFNKSVILYDKNSIAYFDQSNPLSASDQLNDLVLDKDKFDAFLNSQFEDPDYFFCIQLFIKIPFLESKIISEDFTDLQLIINSKLDDNQLHLESLLNSSIFKENSASEELYSLKESFLDPNNERVDEFLNKFSRNDEVD